MRMKHLAATVVAVAALATGTGAAVAASADDDETAILDRAAGQLDVSAEELRRALLDAREAEIDQAVADGELTEDQAEAIKQRLQESGRVLGGFGGQGPGGHHGGRFPGIGEELAAALGITEEELRQAFADGRTVGEIAEAEGRELADVRRALRAAAVERLDAAVDDGRITEAQHDEMVERLDAKLEELADFGGPPFGRGHGGPRGPMLGGGDGRGGASAPESRSERPALFSS